MGLLAITTMMLGAGIAAAAPGSAVELDRARISRHLEQTEAWLRAREVSALSPELRTARMRNLDALHEYRVRGEFPRNTDHPGRRVPYFIDTDGRACAVGHLMIASGHRDLAERIAAGERNDYLRDITTPGAAEWIERSGLAFAEHARIQPGYCGCSEEPTAPVCGVDGMTYPNACMATECAGVDIDHEGACEGTSETGDGVTDGATTGSDTGDGTNGDDDGDDGGRKTSCAIADAHAAGLWLVLAAACRRRRVPRA